MKMVITIEVNDPMTLNDAEVIVRKAMKGFKHDRVLSVEDGATRDVPTSPVNPPAKVRWELYK